MKKYNKKFTPKSTNQIATEVTEKILDCLKEGTIPWKSGIIGEGASMVSYDNQSYRGVNQWILLATMIKNRVVMFLKVRRALRLYIGISLIKQTLNALYVTEKLHLEKFVTVRHVDPS